MGNCGGREVACAMATTPPTDLDRAEALNATLDGHNRTLGLRFVRATGAEVIAELVISPTHHQAFGIVHGGVYCSMVETTTSVGASIHASERGAHAVGLENQTSFLHAVRTGILRVRATPVEIGRRTQLWEASVSCVEAPGEPSKRVAHGRVRLYVMEPRAALAGETVAIKPG